MIEDGSWGTAAIERNYCLAIQALEIDLIEYGCVGAAASGFENTNELRVMKYKEAMQSENKDEWQKAIEKEYKRMEDMKVWKPVPSAKLPGSAYLNMGYEEEVKWPVPCQTECKRI